LDAVGNNDKLWVEERFAHGRLSFRPEVNLREKTEELVALGEGKGTARRKRAVFETRPVKKAIVKQNRRIMMSRMQGRGIDSP
jgi:hypothetical protein